MRGASLFSGVGGLDLGMHRAGVNVVFQCEADPYRREVLARHWPGVPCFEDVRAVGLSGVRERLEQPGRGVARAEVGERSAAADALLDLLFGGFPCQDLSVAGRRRGLAGDRSGLFFEFARIADALLADGGWLLIENVPGLLSSHGGRDFAVLLATLAELGFHDLAWRVLDSRHFGVPQRRRRVFILARRARGGRAREVLLEPESGGGDFEAGREARARTAEGSGVSPALTRRYGKGTDSDATDAFVNALDRKGGGADDNDAQAGHVIAVRASGHAGSNGLGVHQHGDSPTLDREGNVAVTVDPLVSRSSRGKPTPLAPGHNTDSHVAVTAGQVRRLSPSECEALQGFPRGWTLLEPDTDWRDYPQPDGRRYAACGDAVTVNVAYWIGRRLMANEKAAAQTPSTHQIDGVVG